MSCIAMWFLHSHGMNITEYPKHCVVEAELTPTNNI